MSSDAPTPAQGRLRRRGLVAGVAFVLLGVAVLLDEVEVLRLRLAYVLPVVLIAAGAWIILRRGPAGGADR